MMGTGAVTRQRAARGARAAWVLSIALVLGTQAAQAQDAATAGDGSAPSLVTPTELGDADAEARALYKAGVIAFDGGRFRNALDAFQRSYELSQRPELLYNVGSVADRLRLDAVALDAFERYLAAVPESPHAASVKARIDVLREAVAAQREARAEGEQAEPIEPVNDGAIAAEAEVKEETTPLAPPVKQKPSWPKWTLIGAGGATAVVGVIVLAMGQRNRNKIEGASVGTPFSEVQKYDNADALTGAGAALMGIGVAASAAGLVWMLTEPKADKQVALRLTPTGIALGGTL